MTDFDDARADRMYGESASAPTASTPAAAAAVEAPPVPDAAQPPESTPPVETVEEPLTPGEFRPVVPAAIRELRSVPERRMFDTTVRPDLKALVAEGEDGHEYPPAVRQAIAVEVTRIADDLGLTVDDVAAMRASARSIAQTYTPETFAAIEPDAA